MDDGGRVPGAGPATGRRPGRISEHVQPIIERNFIEGGTPQFALPAPAKAKGGDAMLREPEQARPDGPTAAPRRGMLNISLPTFHRLAVALPAGIHRRPTLVDGRAIERLD